MAGISGPSEQNPKYLEAKLAFEHALVDYKNPVTGGYQGPRFKVEAELALASAQRELASVSNNPAAEAQANAIFLQRLKEIAYTQANNSAKPGYSPDDQNGIRAAEIESRLSQMRESMKANNNNEDQNNSISLESFA